MSSSASKTTNANGTPNGTGKQLVWAFKYNDNGVPNLEMDSTKIKSNVEIALLAMDFDQIVKFKPRKSTLWPPTRASHREAIYAQCIGKTQATPCTNCQRGDGKFTRCRVVDFVPANTNIKRVMLRGSCANCHLSGVRCGFRNVASPFALHAGWAEDKKAMMPEGAGSTYISPEVEIAVATAQAKLTAAQSKVCEATAEVKVAEAELKLALSKNRVVAPAPDPDHRAL
ncbi:hypothetical protein MMC13_004719 [Lambiella insularis]|nr:hypothetical protein [Lambiella insularis]